MVTTEEFDKDTILSEERESFRLLLNYCFELSARIRGTPTSNEAEFEANGFFGKQVMHAYTVWSIINPREWPQLPVLGPQIIYDFSSLTCIVRIMFELHVTMWELTSNYQSPEERDFWIDMWHTHSEYERLRVLDTTNSDAREVPAVRVELLKFVQRVESSGYYQKLDNSIKRSVDTKLRIVREAANQQPVTEEFRTWKLKKSVYDMATDAGYSKFHAGVIYRWGSHDVHSLAISLSKILAGPNTVEQQRLCASMFQYASMLLALTTDLFWRVFPVGKVKCPPPPVVQEIVDGWIDFHQYEPIASQT